MIKGYEMILEKILVAPLPMGYINRIKTSISAIFLYLISIFEYIFGVVFLTPASIQTIATNCYEGSCNKKQVTNGRMSGKSPNMAKEDMSYSGLPRVSRIIFTN